VNKAALLAWLDNKSVHSIPLVTAIYKGLAARVRRGKSN
jgi:hypothetical protein